MITQEFIDICHINNIFALAWNFVRFKNPINVIKTLIEKGINGILFDNYQNIKSIKNWLKNLN